MVVVASLVVDCFLPAVNVNVNVNVLLSNSYSVALDGLLLA